MSLTEMKTDEAAGRASVHIEHTKNVGERRGILHEMMRELDSEAIAYWAAKNSHIVVEDESLNDAWVNDGQGDLKECESWDEVLAYGQSRIDKLSTPIRPDKRNKNGELKGGTVTTTLMVAHLPKTMCKEIKNFYPNSNGKGRHSRWVAQDREKAKEYFSDVVDFLATNLIPGGYDAILGCDIQFSESTPHIQIMADTFAPDPKREGKLRAEWSRAYSEHRDVTYIDKKERNI